MQVKPCNHKQEILPYAVVISLSIIYAKIFVYRLIHQPFHQ